jgi:hypothetical protein
MQFYAKQRKNLTRENFLFILNNMKAAKVKKSKNIKISLKGKNILEQSQPLSLKDFFKFFLFVP